MKKEFFFHNLDLLRFIAFLMVFVSHLPFKLNADFLKFVKFNLGNLGVEMFFTLSGFLIMSILLKEKELTNTISLSKFWLRRIFRIFPLYFGTLCLILFISTFLRDAPVSSNDFFTYYFTFTGNFDRVINGDLTIANYIGSGVLWSISIEEQFYLLFPFIMWLLRGSKRLLGAVLVFIYVLTIVSKLFIISTYSDFSLAYRTLSFHPISAFDSITFGCLMAYFSVYYTSTFVKLVNMMNHFTIVIFTILFILLLGLDFRFGNVYFTEILAKQIYVIYFASIVAFTCFHDIASAKSQNKIIHTLNYLGKISFGLYLFHDIIITLLNDIIENQFLLFNLAMICTVAISWLSYNYFEYPLLKFKDRFSIVKTRNLSS